MEVTFFTHKMCDDIFESEWSEGDASDIDNDTHFPIERHVHPFRDMFKVKCHKCGRVGHICSHCPTQDSDAANIAIANDKEAQAFTAIADDIEEAW